MIHEREQRRRQAIKAHKEALAPVICEVRSAGHDIESLDELRRSGTKYTSVIPILLYWLPRISLADAKESIVRTVSVPWAKSIASQTLIEEYENTANEEHSLRWAIGNAIDVLAEPSLLEDLIRITTDAGNGKSREMFVLAFGKIRDPRSVKTLIQLLEDEQVAGHAIVALRKLGAPEALDHFARFANHPQTWIRNEAKKGIAKIMKTHLPDLGLERK